MIRSRVWRGYLSTAAGDSHSGPSVDQAEKRRCDRQRLTHNGHVRLIL